MVVVVVFPEDWKDRHDERNVLLKNVYWHLITYVEKPYTNDQQLRHGFRHVIELPDELIPANWRDLVAGAPGDTGDGNDDNSLCSFVETSTMHLFLHQLTHHDFKIRCYPAVPLEHHSGSFAYPMIVPPKRFL
jgi:hypothetical protein